MLDLQNHIMRSRCRANWIEVGKSYIDGLVVQHEPFRKTSLTTLICPVVDQAALRGLLCRLWDLNLALIAVRRVVIDDKEKENE